jgi:aminoglycoside phosphotransferase
LAVANGVRYIVRKLLRDDIDREFEWKIQNLAFEEGITAEPLVFDRENGFMVFAFLDGVHKIILGTNELKILAHTLQKLHSINIDAQPIKLKIDNSSIDNYPKEYVLCHNDLNPKNIFFSENINFIDWEYAGVNDRYFDVACVCVEFNFGVGMQEVFLKSYFEGEYSMKKLEAYKVVYRALCEKWFKNNP